MTTLLVWSQECQTAFELLRAQLCQPPILRYPDFSKPFRLNCDASNVALGAVLLQEDETTNGYRPVAYASRSLNACERKYAAVEKEALASVWAVQYFRPYLLGKCFTLAVDHRPLLWLMKKQHENARLARWGLAL